MCGLANTLKVKAALDTLYTQTISATVENANHNEIPTYYTATYEVSTNLFEAYEWSISFSDQTNLVDQYSDLRLFFCDEVDYTITSVPPCRKIYASYDSKFMGFFPGTFDAPPLTISASRFVVYFAQLDYYGAGWMVLFYLPSVRLQIHGDGH